LGGERGLSFSELAGDTIEKQFQEVYAAMREFVLTLKATPNQNVLWMQDARQLVQLEKRSELRQPEAVDTEMTTIDDRMMDPLTFANVLGIEKTRVTTEVVTPQPPVISQPTELPARETVSEEPQDVPETISPMPEAIGVRSELKVVPELAPEVQQRLTAGLRAIGEMRNASFKEAIAASEKFDNFDRMMDKQASKVVAKFASVGDKGAAIIKFNFSNPDSVDLLQGIGNNIVVKVLNALPEDAKLVLLLNYAKIDPRTVRITQEKLQRLKDPRIKMISYNTDSLEGDDVEQSILREQLISMAKELKISDPKALLQIYAEPKDAELMNQKGDLLEGALVGAIRESLGRIIVFGGESPLSLDSTGQTVSIVNLSTILRDALEAAMASRETAVSA